MTTTSTAFDATTFRHVIGHFMSGVAVITTRADGQDHGMTASAVCSLSLEPPMIVICLHRRSPTQEAILRSGAFGVSILEQGQDEIAVRFATPRDDKFEAIALHYGRLGQPLLDESLARLECEVSEEIVGGTHRVFVGLVHHADVRPGSPLAYYRGRFGRLELASDDDALRRLRRAVLLREMPLDESLAPDVLAGQLEVPESSVLYGLTRLESEGLVRRDTMRGYVLVPLDPASSDATFEAKLVIDLGAAPLVLRRAADEQLEDLVATAEAAPRVSGERNPERVDELVAATEAFHRQTIGLSGNQALVAAYQRLSVPSVLSRVLLRDDAECDRLSDDHVAIAAALRRRALEDVVRLVRRHNARARAAHRRAIVAAGGRI